MKYIVKNIRQEGDVWKANLKYWQGCACSANTVEVTINQKKRPTKSDVVKVFKEIYP